MSPIIGRIRASDLEAHARCSGDVMPPEPDNAPVETGGSGPSLLIRGGRVYRDDGDVDDPAIRDILIRGSRIVSVTAPDEDAALKEEIVRRAAVLGKAQVIEAR